MVLSDVLKATNNEMESNNSEYFFERTVINKEVKDPVRSCYTYDEGLNITGNGKYNITLLMALSFVLMSMAMDMFGFSVVVAGCSCDFNLTLAERGVLSSTPFIGVLIMSYPWGYFSDTQGRKKTLVLAMGVSFVMGSLSSLSPNWIVMAVFKVIGTSFAAQSATYVLLGECCLPHLRNVYLLLMTTALMMTNTMFYSIGYVTLNLDFNYDLGFVGIHYTPWRLVTLFLALPLGLSAVVLINFYESPKFLANQGRTREAIEIMAEIYRRNGGDPLSFPVKDLILDEAGNDKDPKKSTTFLQSLWTQTAPLFKPPLLLRTIQLFFLTVVIYAVNNSFVMWFPFIVDAFFKSYAKSGGGDSGLCTLILSSMPNSTVSENSTSISIAPTCSSTIALQTVLTGIAHSVSFAFLTAIISKFSDRKKTIMILTFAVSAIGGIGSNLAPEPMSALSMFIVFLLTAMGMGIIPAYYVELYPTSYRGMVACLGVMVARLTSLIGINLVGQFLIDYCTASFYLCSFIVLCGLVVACFLPSDKLPKKCIK